MTVRNTAAVAANLTAPQNNVPDARVALRALLTQLHRRLGRAPRAYEIGSAQSQGLLELLARELPLTVLDEPAADADLVLIHAELEFDALVQTLYAVRGALRPDTVLCGLGLNQAERWPAAGIAVQQFLGDYRREGDLWIANTAGIELLKLWPEFEQIAHLVRQVQSEHDARYRDPAYRRRHGCADGSPLDALSEEAVRWGMRLFLDREPQSPAEIADKLQRLPDVPALRRELAQSSEFKQKNSGLFWLSCSGDEPPMDIELNVAETERAALLSHIQATWEHLGATEPHWSVLTSEQFKRARIAQSEEAFYRTGEGNVVTLLRTLERNGLDARRLRGCLEYGCGLGRVTRWLAPRFSRVHAYDISRAHLQGAEHYLSRLGIDNVTFRHVAGFADLGALPKVDLVYSVIVLQHNPPPVIAAIVQALLAALNPGGVAYFQVPTYQRGYRFAVEDYLRARTGQREMEMHVLPQAQVLALAARAGARVLEVLEDRWTGIVDGGRSNTFVIQKA